MSIPTGLRRMTDWIRAAAAGAAIGLNTLIWTVVLYPVGLLRLIAPGRLADAMRRASARIAELWIGFNNRVLDCYRSTRWEQKIPDNLDPNGCYLINCNHQSWVDILVLQRTFNRRAPFMRFFLKRELIWVPFLGLAWWVLDFPFMRRYSRAKVARKPQLLGKDLEAARTACEKFKDIPVSIMSFMEGTRFSPDKHARQKSPYRHLLKPRVGGVGEVLYSLGERLRSLIDVTIVYPDGVPTFWQLLSGRVSRIVVVAREIRIPPQLLGRNLRTDRQYRRELEAWVAQVWEEKDRLVDAVLNGRRIDAVSA